MREGAGVQLPRTGPPHALFCVLIQAINLLLHSYSPQADTERAVVGHQESINNVWDSLHAIDDRTRVE